MRAPLDELQAWISAEHARRSADLHAAGENIPANADARVTWMEVMMKAHELGITLTTLELRAALVKAARARTAR